MWLFFPPKTRYASVCMRLYYNREQLFIPDIISCTYEKCLPLSIVYTIHTLSLPGSPCRGKKKIFHTPSVSLVRYKLSSHTCVDKPIISSPSCSDNIGHKVQCTFRAQRPFPLVSTLGTATTNPRATSTP